MARWAQNSIQKGASLVLVCAAMLAQTNVTSAVTVEVARKCEAFTCFHGGRTTTNHFT
jgi:hypothetical protein